ncbi:unnamed protein product [Notodromas monacha]|uniref:Methyltransferase FkbM domain-containing protein n=1 Tax=Notodromas monacha TaxID=399045 RepID=A0A7R9C0V9_9CRUS|nr:unnamed protein product [Notodromas monacha]CAG0924848.1 unnamed protein product [Notodromas monacha]
MSAKDGTLPVGGSGLHNVPVECYPLYDILVACNSTKLDALFLDVQGPEYDILTTVPWENVDIQLIMVEISTMNKNMKQIEKNMLALLEPHGYKLIKQLGRDFIYSKV